MRCSKTLRGSSTRSRRFRESNWTDRSSVLGALAGGCLKLSQEGAWSCRRRVLGAVAGGCLELSQEGAWSCRPRVRNQIGIRAEIATIGAGAPPRTAGDEPVAGELLAHIIDTRKQIPGRIRGRFPARDDVARNGRARQVGGDAVVADAAIAADDSILAVAGDIVRHREP